LNQAGHFDFRVPGQVQIEFVRLAKRHAGGRFKLAEPRPESRSPWRRQIVAVYTTVMRQQFKSASSTALSLSASICANSHYFSAALKGGDSF
jgi:hypothetical protein